MPLTKTEPICLLSFTRCSMRYAGKGTHTRPKALPYRLKQIVENTWKNSNLQTKFCKNISTFGTMAADFQITWVLICRSSTSSKVLQKFIKTHHIYHVSSCQVL